MSLIEERNFKDSKQDAGTVIAASSEIASWRLIASRILPKGGKSGIGYSVPLLTSAMFPTSTTVR